jgi:methionine synthase II (cobalamin-independent)
MGTAGLLPTTLVGSYPQPDWLIDRERLGERLPPRVRALEIWRVPEPWLEQAQDDATLLALRDFELAGIDIVTDGEIRRESYSNRFATMLGGLDVDNPGVFVERVGIENLATSSSYAGTRTGRSRSPCPGPSPWASRRRTTITGTSGCSPSTSRRP